MCVTASAIANLFFWETYDPKGITLIYISARVVPKDLEPGGQTPNGVLSLRAAHGAFSLPVASAQAQQQHLIYWLRGLLLRELVLSF